MSAPAILTGLQLRSCCRSTGELELSLVPVTLAPPGPSEVVVRIEATPINPSDIGVLLGAADVRTARRSGPDQQPITVLQVPAPLLKTMAGRLDQSLPVGNEGAGVVVAAGSSAAAQALLGRTVALYGGAMYSQYRCVDIANCLELPAGTSAAAGASCFVNPLTALGMVETMRREGHKGIVHTAAASNLGQMLARICHKDGINLVNIVRRPEQAAILHNLGARHVCISSAPDFEQQLTQALIDTGATLGFDATGGGELAGTLLGCMEAALTRDSKTYSRYGSTTHKQVYIYGRLEPGNTVLGSNYGMAWGVGGWLVFNYLARLGAEVGAALRHRVIAELHTTFRSDYAQVISLAQALHVDVIAAYSRRATGAKYLINPNAK